MAYSELPAFPPPPSAYETPDFLRALGDARAYLGELKGLAQSIPNKRILISTLGLQEAQSSSEIENIVTTQQALHEYRLRPGDNIVKGESRARNLLRQHRVKQLAV